jgi:hypothetical protein
MIEKQPTEGKKPQEEQKVKPQVVVESAVPSRQDVRQAVGRNHRGGMVVSE